MSLNYLKKLVKKIYGIFPKQIKVALKYVKIYSRHKKREERFLIGGGQNPIYYIIRFCDEMHCGWTVWERVVLYNSIYAEEKGMIPVVDMKNYSSIYQEKEELGKVNVWDLYYNQPGGISLEKAYDSKNYILADASMEWFRYIRVRNPRKFTMEYLREMYQNYIQLKAGIVDKLEENFNMLLTNDIDGKKPKLLGICIRGSDYLQYHHPKQPLVSELTFRAKQLSEQFDCTYYFVATEDFHLLNQIKEQLPQEKLITYHAGQIKKTDGYIGDALRKTVGARAAAMEYLTILYIINKCDVLVGGVCGATIVAQYRRNPPYQYIEITDMQETY